MKNSQPISATTDEQDSAWKELLDECLSDFVAFFFPDIASEVDWTKRWEPKDKELAKLKPDFPEGKLYAGKLYQVWLKNGKAKWLLIHIEVQGRAHRGFARRVYDYNYRIRAKHPGIDVVSLVVITETKRPVAGRYAWAHWGCSLVFRFPLVQLASFAGQLTELENDANPFATAVVAQLKALETRGNASLRFVWKRRLIEGLYAHGWNRERIVALFKFMEFAMKLPAELEDKIMQTIRVIEEGKQMSILAPFEIRAMEKGKLEGKLEGLQQGLQQGIENGLLEAVLLQLAHRLGELSNATQAKLRKLSFEQLQSLLVALLDFHHKADLLVWLKAQTSPAVSKQKSNGKHAI